MILPVFFRVIITLVGKAQVYLTFSAIGS